MEFSSLSEIGLLLEKSVQFSSHAETNAQPSLVYKNLESCRCNIFCRNGRCEDPYRGCSYWGLHALYDSCWFCFIYSVLPFSVFFNERIVDTSPVIVRPFILCALFVSRDVLVNICCIYKKGIVFTGRKSILCSWITQLGNSLKEPAWSGFWAP